MSERKTLFQTKLKKANVIANTEEISEDFPEARGLGFHQFWKWLGPPIKYEKEQPIFDYEQELLAALHKHKHLWVKKATGLGVTELMIRWIAWKCLTNNDMKEEQIDTNIILVTAPRIDLAITIMGRLKNLFHNHKHDEFKTKETVCVLNGNRIEAFPSHHLATARGLNPQIVFLDEADFFPPSQQQEARDVSERYIAKTDPYIIMVSTPNLPGGLYEAMERERKSIYIRKYFNYELGLGKIYTEQEIEQARESPSFEREYNLKYGYGIGNIFVGLDDIIQEYDLELEDGNKGIYADPGFGSSKFGVVGFELLNGILYVKEATQYDRPSPGAMIDVMVEKANMFGTNCKVDAAHPGFIKDLTLKGIPALPINFGQEDKKKQTMRSKMTIEAAQAVKEKRVRIHPMFTDLIAQLRAVQFDEKGGPDKKQFTFDLGDAFLMGCFDMKEFDYSSIDITKDGKLMDYKKPKKEGGITIRSEVVE